MAPRPDLPPRPLPAWRSILPLLALAALVAALAAMAATPLAIGATAAGAGALAFGLWRVLVDARRIASLRGAVGRAAADDFTLPAAIDGDDALAALGRAIDASHRTLGLRIGVLQALAEIERAIAANTDAGALVEIALPALLQAADAAAAAIGVVDGDPVAAIDFWLLASRAGGPIERSQVPVDSESALFQDGDAPLPATIANRLRSVGAAAPLLVLPIGDRARPHGVIAIRRRDATPLAREQTEAVDELARGLDAALLAAAQERARAATAHLDQLTGLPNRAALLAALDSELALAQRNRSRSGILLLDLDRFKQANEALGQGAGDELLRAAAERIRRAVREDDLVARYGGDEFAIVVGGLASGADSGKWARELIRDLSRPYDIGGETIYVGASVGIAIFPDDGTAGDDLLVKADTAMHRAKDDGRSRFAYYEDSMNIETRRRVARDRELRQALERNEFVLHYQPQVDLRSGRIATVEALLRWPHPELGLLRPAAFLRFAEENGLVDVIGQWVLREASQQFQRWRAAGIVVPRLAINVAVEQMQRSHFAHSVEEALRAAGMPRDSLEIEITESMLTRGGKATINAITALSHAGVVFTIDAFGSGIASFGWLKTVQAKVIKLDQGFIADVTTNNDAAMIVAALVKMAHSLRKEIVAEGVERRDQLEFLKAIGCNKAQGHVISRPLVADELARLVIERNGAEPVAAGLLKEPLELDTPKQALDLAPPDDEWLTVPFDPR